MYKVSCGKCTGRGKINSYIHVDGGICFTCGGSGSEMVDFEEYQNRVNKTKKEWVVFDNGVFITFKSEDDIFEKYGKFYCSEFGGISLRVSYSCKNIMFWRKEASQVEQSVLQAWKDCGRALYTKRILNLQEFIEISNDIEEIEFAKVDIQILQQKMEKLELM
ncbi:hypothetical protein EEL31_09195 [Brevibacillus laterosporus]|nr:PCRF domain-containing protein [Brevibacillus laterosporus]TPG68682.1 hypothetical protein EEL31_09195 [Brevibacillus laterosporus]